MARLRRYRLKQSLYRLTVLIHLEYTISKPKINWKFAIYEEDHD